MINEFECNIIIDHWSERFHIKVNEDGRDNIINMFKKNEILLSKRDMDFNTVVEQLMIQSICEMRYPGMNLYDYAYAPWSKN